MDARILLVEDDPSIREVTAIGLRNAGLHGRDRRATARQGLDRFGGRAVRPRPARRHAAAAGRPRGLPRDPPDLDGPGRDAHRARRHASTSSSVSRPAPTTTSEAVRGARSSSPASAPRCAGPAADPDEAERLQLGPLVIDLAGRTVTRDGRDDRADPDRVRPAGRARPARRPGPQPRRPARPDLGLRLPRRLAPGGRRDRAPAGQGRGRPGDARADPDRPRRGLQGRPLSPRDR